MKNACENGNIHNFLQRLYESYAFSYLFSTDEGGGDIATQCHVLTALQDFSMGCETTPKSSPVQALSDKYVCMYACMYVCTYVCMCMHVYMYVCMYVCVYVCMWVCVYVCMYVCMYAFIYVGK